MSSATDELVVSPLSAAIQLVDPKTGIPSAYGQKFFQRIIQAINGALDILGQFNGVIGPAATVEGHPGTVQHTVQNLTGAGQLNSLTNVVNDVNLDHVADTVTWAKTTVNAAIGAIESYNVLLASGPTANKALIYNGTTWQPSDVPAGSVSGLNFTAVSGVAVPAQIPALSTLSGSVTAAQVPALSALSGQITTGQLPASGLSVTIVTAQLTTLGTQGSMTFTNGILTAQTPAT